MTFTLDALADRISERARSGDERSYTRELLGRGPRECAKKLGEEAIEAVLAAVSDEKAELVYESADLLYHLLVVLQSRGVALSEVYDELERRTARSGIDEKESRRK